MRDKVEFAFASNGYIKNIEIPFLTLKFLIYTISAVIINTVEISNAYGFKDPSIIEDGRLHNWRSPENHPLFDRVIDRYTNWNEGCSLNNTLTSCGWFLHDLSEQIVRNDKYEGDLWHMCSDRSYGMSGVDRYGIEIITDALDVLQEYSEKNARINGEKCHFHWNENNEALLKLFHITKDGE